MTKKTTAVWRFIFGAFLLVVCLNACKSGRTIIECGGAGAFVCPPGLYCDLGADCGGIDRKGVCRYQPEDCSADEDPVCGCDAVDYRNACFANSKGVSIGYPGKCIKATTPRALDIPEGK